MSRDIWSKKKKKYFFVFQFVSEHVVRYSVYHGQDQHGVTSYLVNVEVLVGGPNDQGGVSQDPEGPNSDGPGPQDPPSGQQGLLVPQPEGVNGANGDDQTGGDYGGSTHSSLSPPAEVMANLPLPSGFQLRSPLADLNGQIPAATQVSTILPEARHDQENPAATGPQTHSC